jgi:hypothetical protein
MSEYVSMYHVNDHVYMYMGLISLISIRSTQSRFAVRSVSPRHGLETSHNAQGPFGAIRSGSRV